MVSSLEICTLVRQLDQLVRSFSMLIDGTWKKVSIWFGWRKQAHNYLLVKNVGPTGSLLVMVEVGSYRWMIVVSCVIFTFNKPRLICNFAKDA